MIFFLTLAGITMWQFLPQFVFPFLQSLAFLCWLAPHNATANFIGGGLGGMGFLNLSLDWSNVGHLSQMGSMFLTPCGPKSFFFFPLSWSIAGCSCQLLNGVDLACGITI